METQSDLIGRQLAHLQAARRLRDGIVKYGRLSGLQRFADYHTMRAGKLAAELCDGRQAIAGELARKRGARQVELTAAPLARYTEWGSLRGARDA